MTVPGKGLRNLLSIAEEASRRAGKFLSNARLGDRMVIADSRRDVKIAADKRSERILIKFLRKQTRLPVLSEESGAVGANAGGLMWVIDPLDGSLNFSRGIPVSCVSVGLWDGPRPLAGAVYDFNKNEMFSGIAGSGAWLNGRAIRPSTVSSKRKAVLLTGFPSKSDFSKKAVLSFVDGVRSYKKVRLLGSAALSLAYVASGRADAYHEKDIMIWDIAAGLPIISGAGGRFTIKISPYGNKACVHASNGALLGRTPG